MEVQMKYCLHSMHTIVLHDVHTHAASGLHYSPGQPRQLLQDCCGAGCIEVQNSRHLCLRDQQAVASGHWHRIQESEGMLRFEQCVSSCLAVQDPQERVARVVSN